MLLLIVLVLAGQIGQAQTIGVPTITGPVYNYTGAAHETSKEIVQSDGGIWCIYNCMISEEHYEHRFTYLQPRLQVIKYITLPNPIIGRNQAYYAINDMEVKNGICFFCGNISRMTSIQNNFDYDNFGVVGMFELSDPATTIHIVEVPDMKDIERIAIDISGGKIYCIGLCMPPSITRMSVPNKSCLVEITMPIGGNLANSNTVYSVVEPDASERFLDVSCGAYHELIISSRIIGSNRDFGIRTSKALLTDDTQISNLSRYHVFEADFYENASWNDDIDRVVLDAQSGQGSFAAHGGGSNMVLCHITGSWTGLFGRSQKFSKGSPVKVDDLSVSANGAQVDISIISSLISNGQSAVNYSYANRFVDLLNNDNRRWFYTKNLFLSNDGKMTSSSYLNAHSLLVAGRDIDSRPIYFIQDPTHIDDEESVGCTRKTDCYQFDHYHNVVLLTSPVIRTITSNRFYTTYYPNVTTSMPIVTVQCSNNN